MAIYESGEMYLETILKLRTAEGLSRAVDIASELGIARSSVSEAVKNLKERGYISVGEDGNVELTSSGLEIAEAIYERHRVLKKYFVSLGVSEEIAEGDACRIEHVISDETFQKIKENTEK